LIHAILINQWLWKLVLVVAKHGYWCLASFDSYSLAQSPAKFLPSLSPEKQRKKCAVV
jgi:hypothetical protein